MVALTLICSTNLKAQDIEESISRASTLDREIRELFEQPVPENSPVLIQSRKQIVDQKIAELKEIQDRLADDVESEYKRLVQRKQELNTELLVLSKQRTSAMNADELASEKAHFEKKLAEFNSVESRLEHISPALKPMNTKPKPPVQTSTYPIHDDVHDDALKIAAKAIGPDVDVDYRELLLFKNSHAVEALRVAANVFGSNVRFHYSDLLKFDNAEKTQALKEALHQTEHMEIHQSGPQLLKMLDELQVSDNFRLKVAAKFVEHVSSLNEYLAMARLENSETQKPWRELIEASTDDFLRLQPGLPEIQRTLNATPFAKSQKRIGTAQKKLALAAIDRASSNKELKSIQFPDGYFKEPSLRKKLQAKESDLLYQSEGAQSCSRGIGTLIREKLVQMFGK